MNDLSAKPESADKIKELTALLEQTRKNYGDEAPLVVPNPKSPEWTPPAGQSDGGAKKKRKAK